MGNEHNNSIEILRVASAFGIVWFHVHGYGSIFAYSGLICFIEIAANFVVVKAATSKIITKRARRLFGPWIFWSIVYAFLNLQKGHPFYGEDISFISAIFTGTYIHLWYLPFLFFCTLAGSIVIPKLLTYSNSIWFHVFSVLVSATILFSAFLLRSNGLIVSTPWKQWIHALPGIFIGFSTGLLLNSAISPRAKKIFLTGLAAAIAGISFLIIAKGDGFLGVPYLFGTVLTLLGLRVNTPEISLINKISGLTMGIYCIHLFFASAIHGYLNSIKSPELLAVIVFSLSGVTIYLLKSIRYPFLTKIIKIIT